MNNTTEEQSMYYTVFNGSIDVNTAAKKTTYYHIQDSDDKLALVCDGEQITITWKDLFFLLKWAYKQWGGVK